jgi:hypothetical protein
LVEELGELAREGRDLLADVEAITVSFARLAARLR